MNPFLKVTILWRTSYISNVALAIFFVSAAASIVYIIQAFILAAYSVTQTQTAMLLGGLLVLMIIWSLVGVKLIAKFGNRKILFISASSAVVASYFLTASPYTVTLI